MIASCTFIYPLISGPTDVFDRMQGNLLEMLKIDISVMKGELDEICENERAAIVLAKS